MSYVVCRLRGFVLSRHDLDRDFWSRQFKKWHLYCQKSLNSYKSDISTVQKVTTVQKMMSQLSKKSGQLKNWHLDMVYALKSHFLTLSQSSLLIQKNGVSTDKKKSWQFKKWHLDMAYALKSWFLTLSQSRLSIETIQKASLNMSRKYQQFEKGHLKTLKLKSRQSWLP
jgi:hypothetical protein